MPCVIALQPTLGYGLKPLTIYEEKYLAAIPFRNWVSSQSMFYDEVRKRIPVLNMEFARHGIAFIDLAEMFKDVNRQVYLDSIHYRDFGNCVLGKVLARQWEKKLWVREEISRSCSNEEPAM